MFPNSFVPDSSITMYNYLSNISFQKQKMTLVKIVHRQRNHLLPKLFIFCFLLLFSLAGFMAGSDLTQQNGSKHNLGHEILDVAIVICVKFYLRSLSYLLRCRNTAKIQLKVLMFKFSSNQLMVNHVFPCYRIFVQTHGLSR